MADDTTEEVTCDWCLKDFQVPDDHDDLDPLYCSHCGSEQMGHYWGPDVKEKFRLAAGFPPRPTKTP